MSRTTRTARSPRGGVIAVALTAMASATAIVVPSAAHATTAPAPVQRPAAGHAKPWHVRQRIAIKAVAWAKKEKGKPYRYGATGPSDFDCSGLVGYVYRKAGIKLPRTTTAIYHAVRVKVPWRNLQPGDLVFFYRGRSHVGIISKIVGKRIYMIHAPHTGDHVRQVLLDSYRKATFNGAVRPY